MKAGEAAQTSTALEKERRNRELTPRFQVTYECEVDDGRIRFSGSPDALLRVLLAGPSDLLRLDELTVTIRDDDDLKQKMELLAHRSNVPAPERAGDQVCGPYGFIPPAYYAAVTASETLGEPSRTMKAVRIERRTEMSVGETFTFELWRTGPPSWLRDAIARRWLEDSGIILRLRLDCCRGEWEPWTFLCEIDTGSQLSAITIPTE